MAAVIPGRRTFLVFDIPEKTVERPAHVERRTAAEMARRRPGKQPPTAPKNRNMLFVGGEAWILLPREAELAQTVIPLPPVGGGISGGPIPKEEVNVAPGVKDVILFRRADDLPWVTPSPSVIGSGFPAYQKQIPAGTTTAPNLDADATAYPPPADDLPQIYPTNRILSSKKTYPENTPFLVRMELPQNWEGGDVYYRFYFGGPCPVDVGSPGGAFCVEFRGSGKAILKERDFAPGAAEPWRPRFEFQYAEPAAGSRYLDSVSIIPHAKNRIAFFTLSSEVFPSIFSLFGALASMAQTPFGRLHPHYFRDMWSETGHHHVRAQTGAGQVRMDQRQDMREKFSVIRMKYPSLQDDFNVGTLVDAPFAVPYPLPAFTPMRLTIDAHLAPGTAVVGTVYDALTHTPLTKDINGFFLSNVNQREYYVLLTLSSADGTQTPVVWGWSLRVAGQYKINAGAPKRGNLTSVTIEGPDIDPTHEEGMLQARDLTNQLELLRRRDRIRSTVSLYDEVSDELISHLMEGETLSPEAEWRGKPGEVYPHRQWRDFSHLRLVGMWARCADQLSLSLEDFSADPTAPPGPHGEGKPWRVTEIIREIFHNLGFDEDELDIPVLPIRLWSNLYFQHDPNNFMLAAGTDPASAIRKLAWDYLSMVLVRDPNAGPRGMWRLLKNPVQPYQNTLCQILTEPDTSLATPRLSHVSAAYGPSTTYASLWRSWVKAPEVNIILIQGMLKDGKGNASGKIHRLLVNNNSIYNPDHPDYLGRAVPVIFPVDPELDSQAAVDWMARRVYDAAAHAQKWFECQAPLFLVQDPLDTHQVRLRPLRINDLITVGGPDEAQMPAMVRSCRIDYTSDRNQTMVLQGMILTDNDLNPF